MSFKDDEPSRRSCRRQRTSVVRRFPRSGDITPPLIGKGPNSRGDIHAIRLTRDLAAAVLCRLEIPDDRTIVGLLNVGRSADNREEVEQWVALQLTTLNGKEWNESIDVLCRRLVRELDQASSR